MLEFLNSHKTKITGFIIILAGTLQSLSVHFQQLLEPGAYAKFTIILGIVVAVIGFINTHINGQQGK